MRRRLRYWRLKRRKPVYKPGFVRRPGGRRDDHFSRKPIARFLQQPTRESMAGRTEPLGGEKRRRRRPRPCSLFDLAPSGVYRARPVARPAGELLPRRFTLTAGPEPARRFAFCCTFPGLAAGGRYPSLRPPEPGLSSRQACGEPIVAAPVRPGRRSSDRLPTRLNDRPAHGQQGRGGRRKAECAFILPPSSCLTPKAIITRLQERLAAAG